MKQAASIKDLVLPMLRPRPVTAVAPRADPGAAAGPTTASGAGWLAALVAIAFFLLLAWPVHVRSVGNYWTETDLYRWYAPDADRLRAGRFPDHNAFNPPGYPALLAALWPLTGDHFVTGKWLSLVAASLTAMLTFLLFRRLFGAEAGLLATGILLLSGEYTRYAIQATTDALFLLLCLGTLLVLTQDRWRPGPWAALLGGLCGAAYLFRYNGVFLLAPVLAALLSRPGPWRRRLAWTATCLAALAVTASPWLWANWVQHGSPFFSGNYHDIGMHLYGEPGYRSPADVVLRHPGRFLARYGASVAQNLGRFSGASLWVLPVGALAWLGVVLALRRPRRPVALVLVALAGHVALMSLTHWEARYHFLAAAVLGGFAAWALLETAGWLAARLPRSRVARPALTLGLVLLVLVPSGERTWERLDKTMEREPLELFAALAFVRTLEPRDAPLMMPKPHLAYLSGRPWQRLPHVGSLDELREVVRQSGVPLVAWDRMGWRIARPLAALEEPDRAPAWLRPIYVDRGASLVIYRVTESYLPGR